MTVRVSKPKFNLREKLSELDVPVGSHGGRIMQSSNAEETFSLVKAGRRNMVINGQMWINQRNASSSYTIPHATGGSYGGPDRWAINEATDGSVSVNMDGDPPNYPEVSMFTKAMQIACTGTDTSLASTQNLHFFQNIEGHNIAHLGWGTRNAKPVTLSFWVKTNHAGYYSVGLENNGTDRCCIRQFYNNGSSKWQKYVLTYPGCGTGSWPTGTATGIRLRFCLASGDQYDDGVEGQWVTTDELVIGENQTNFMVSTSNRFFITGVQLEEGTEATPFEQRSITEELAYCQRYYWKPHPGNNSTTYDQVMIAMKVADTDGGRAASTFFPVMMRAAPSVVFEDRAGDYGGTTTASRVTCQHHNGTYAHGVTWSWATTPWGCDGPYHYPYGISGFTKGDVGNFQCNKLEFNAEL